MKKNVKLILIYEINLIYLPVIYATRPLNVSEGNIGVFLATKNFEFGEKSTPLIFFNT